VHYGLWEPGTPNHAESIRNLDRCVAEHLALPPGARVLDAGCGIGGTSRLLASGYGLRVVGATLSLRQASGAARRARRLAPPIRPQFLLADFARTAFADATFDGIVAIESFCHAERKVDVLAEAHRLLRPGGRLVVADGFRADDRPLADDARYRALCHGMALPGLAGAADLVAQLGAAGLRVEGDLDLTAAILPSAHRIATLSRIGVRVCRALHLPRAWLAHGEAGLAQLPLFREGLLSYRLLVAAKAG
jgi:cyclopropane fatty-acyl-phospholipid synthase-like methyltransferase